MVYGRRLACSSVVGVWIEVVQFWALSRGAALKRVSVSGDRVVAMILGMIDCQARHGAAACRWTAEPTPQVLQVFEV